MQTSTLTAALAVSTLPVKTTILFVINSKNSAPDIQEAERAVTTRVANSHVVRLRHADALKYLGMGIYDVIVLWTDTDADEEISLAARDLRSAMSTADSATNTRRDVPIIVFASRPITTPPTHTNSAVKAPDFMGLAAAASASLQKTLTS